MVLGGSLWEKVGDFMFIGEFHHSLDDKNRIIIPSKMRYELGEKFIVTRGLDNCLFVYPKDEWENIIKKYKELPNIKDARNFMRFFLSGATECEFDKQGRIKLATPLVNFANLNKDCVVIGVNDRIEIWGKENWGKFISSNEDNFSDIADNLFSATFME